MLVTITNIKAESMNIQIISTMNQHHQKHLLTTIIMKMILQDKENCWKKFLQKSKNKRNHSKYGNRNQTKQPNHYKMMTLNKGSSNISTHKNKIKHMIVQEKTDILVLTESNMKDNDLDTIEDYKNFNIENQVMPGNEASRVLIMIRKGIKYERLNEYESPDVSMAWIKIKTVRRKGFAVGGIYLEWKQNPNIPGPNTRELSDQKERLSKIMEKVVEVSRKFDDTIIMGDINIDLYEPNDPMKDYTNKKLNEIYEDKLTQAGMHQLNFEPTHHWAGYGSTLIDHCFTTQPQKTDGVKNIRSMIADHDAVSLNFHIKDMYRRQQTFKHRDYRNINSENLTKLIKESEKLSKIFNSGDPDQIADTLVTEYNRILNELAPAKNKQIKDDDIKYIDNEIKEMKAEAESRLTDAIKDKSHEKWRLAKYARNTYSKALDKAKTAYYKNILNKDYHLWKTVKCKNKRQIPTEIMWGGRKVTSPKKYKPS